MLIVYLVESPDSSVGKESACNAGEPSLSPGLGRSAGGGLGHLLQYSWASFVAQLVKNLPAMQENWVGKGKGYPLQDSGLENSMDCIVYGVAKSWTGLSDFHFTSRVIGWRLLLGALVCQHFQSTLCMV